MPRRSRKNTGGTLGTSVGPGSAPERILLYDLSVLALMSSQAKIARAFLSRWIY